MDKRYIVYGAKGSGSVAVEAALTLIGRPYDVVETASWYEGEQKARIEKVNPLGQVPALVLPTGDLMTESAAILIWLAEQHPEARLAPAAGDPARPGLLRWMAYVSSAIYSLYWLRDDPSRLVKDPAAMAQVEANAAERIAGCWRMMDGQLTHGRHILGEELTVLDLYVAVVSRWTPGRERFCREAPGMAEAVRRVDQDPRLVALWAERFPFKASSPAC